MKKKPFFANFVEKQITETNETQGGQLAPTSPTVDMVTIPERDSVTKPDADTVTRPVADQITKPNMDAVTMKYPSDQEG